MRRVGLLLVLILLNGCISRSAGTPETGSLYRERISRPQTERHLERRELVLALHENLESSWEISRLQAVLEKQQIRLKVLLFSDRDVLSALVRSGRADLMAGTFSADEIRSLHLLPVLPYTGSDGNNQFCFAVRHDDHILENLLGSAEGSGKNEEKNKK